jgi:hypothetical protein
MTQKFVRQSDRFIIGLGYTVQYMGIKRCRTLRRFQKYKLTLVTKCTKKKLFLKNMLNWDFSVELRVYPFEYQVETGSNTGVSQLFIYW